MELKEPDFEDQPAKEQLRLFFAGEAARLWHKFQRYNGEKEIPLEDVKRAVDVARGLKEIESIPTIRRTDKEIASKSTEELLSEIEKGKS